MPLIDSWRDEVFSAACLVETCPWERNCLTEAEGRMLSVLHVLTQHPDVYELATGRSIHEARLTYREYLVAFSDQL